MINSAIQSKESRLFKVLLGTLIALVVADGIISEFLITNGAAREGNPLLQTWIGDDMFLPIKLLGVFLATVCLSYIGRNNARLSLICTTSFVGVYTVVVYWSLSIVLYAQL